MREYPGWTEEVPDVVKANDILSHLAEWEAAKWQLRDLAAQLPPSDRKAYDDELTRFSMCGDAAGVTVWKY